MHGEKCDFCNRQPSKIMVSHRNEEMKAVYMSLCDDCKFYYSNLPMVEQKHGMARACGHMIKYPK